MNSVQFTEKELAPLRRCINAYKVTSSQGIVSYHYEVACGTVVYTRASRSADISLVTSKSFNRFRSDVKRDAPVYCAVITRDNRVVGDQVAIDIIADTVGR